MQNWSFWEGWMLEHLSVSLSPSLALKQSAGVSVCWGSSLSLTSALDYTFSRGRSERCVIHLITTLSSSEVWNNIYL